MQGFLSSNLSNLVFFNFIWVGLVIGRESLLPLMIPIVASYTVILIRIGKIEIYQILFPTIIGITIDSSLTITGIYEFSGANLILPIWLVLLWIAFSTTLAHSLSFIRKYRHLSTITGATLLPFNYAIGERLGAVSFAEPYILTLIIIGFTWSLFFPLLFIVSDESFKNKISA